MFRGDPGPASMLQAPGSRTRVGVSPPGSCTQMGLSPQRRGPQRPASLPPPPSTVPEPGTDPPGALQLRVPLLPHLSGPRGEAACVPGGKTRGALEAVSLGWPAAPRVPAETMQMRPPDAESPSETPLLGGKLGVPCPNLAQRVRRV